MTVPATVTLLLLSATSILSTVTALGITPQHLETIAGGGVAVVPDWIEPNLVKRMRQDARQLFDQGYFVPDGLTNTALKKEQQGFSQAADRQTFRGGDGWYDAKAGNVDTRLEFADQMKQLRLQLAKGLNRPTLAPEGVRKHEMTYNWYEPDALLGRHLDEHHEETKGPKGWLLPTRRSVTWLVYLNDKWNDDEGGALHTFPRKELSKVPVGSHEGNLQVGWIDQIHPVFLDAWRPTGLTALYQLDGKKKRYISQTDFEVPRQPIEFESFLSSSYQGGRFEQISTARLDPRFVKSSDANTLAAAASSDNTRQQQQHFMEVLPAAGTLVVFDSVTLPHSVNKVTGNRQRIACTGWFHEDNQSIPMV